MCSMGFGWHVKMDADKSCSFMALGAEATT
jgi:hypothetical protein